MICPVLIRLLCDVVIGCAFCFQAEDGIRDLVRSRGLGDVYKRQVAYYLQYMSKAAILTRAWNVKRKKNKAQETRE